MNKYHINDKGEPGKCSAAAGNCPFGEAEDHYASKTDARQAYETSQINSWLKESDARIEAESYVDLYREAISESEEAILKLNETLDGMPMDDPSYGDAIRALDDLQMDKYDNEEKLRRWEEELSYLPEASFPEIWPADGNKPNVAGKAMSGLPKAFQSFLAGHSSVHKSAQGDEFEEFFASHLLETGVQEIKLDSLTEETDEKVKASLQNLKDLNLTDKDFAKNELGESYFIRHPNGVNQFPDYVVATPDHIMNVELKSGNSFSYIMLGAHTPKVTDVFLLADFQSKKEMTLLFIGDHVSADKLQEYDDLRKDAEAIKAKSKAIGGGLKVESGISFRTEGVGPFRHPDREQRQARVIQAFNKEEDR